MLLSFNFFLVLHLAKHLWRFRDYFKLLRKFPHTKCFVKRKNLLRSRYLLTRQKLVKLSMKTRTSLRFFFSDKTFFTSFRNTKKAKPVNFERFAFLK